jgi:polysaccharide deacetylase family protein (PEP-CTERM system associated)
MDVAHAPVTPDGHVVNAMTVDVEDYFQVSAFERVVARERWDGFESRVCRNTERLLALFASGGVTATFFVLGWVAERFPGLVRRIAEAGHELGSHGYAHRLVYEMTPREFGDDLHRARIAIEAAAGAPVMGYRAPSFSITRRSLWAFDQLIAEGFAYDASVYPIHHDRYGIPDAPRHPYTVERPAGSILEVPGSTVRIGGQNLPIGGGGYFRLLPYTWIRHGIARVNDQEQQAVTFYIHPWEIDPAQPRIDAPLLSRIRHYRNLDRTESRLQQLLTDFSFAPNRTVMV